MDEDDKIISNPKYIGPGVWFIIHLKAYNAITPSSKKEFIEFMELLKIKFPCKKCRKHITKYLNENPIINYWNIYDNYGNDVGMFQYTWMFHNAVNMRLNKPHMDWKTAWNLYSNIGNGICNKHCNEDNLNETFIDNSYILDLPPKLKLYTQHSNDNNNNNGPSVTFR